MTQANVTAFPLPQTYEQWHHCIRVECGLELTPTYIAERISALNDKKNAHTQRFVKLYGEEHLQRVIAWFFHAKSLTT